VFPRLGLLEVEHHCDDGQQFVLEGLSHLQYFLETVLAGDDVHVELEFRRDPAGQLVLGPGVQPRLLDDRHAGHGQSVCNHVYVRTLHSFLFRLLHLNFQCGPRYHQQRQRGQLDSCVDHDFHDYKFRNRQFLERNRQE